MKDFSTFLIERAEIGYSKKAYVSLSSEAQRAIDEWERSGWENGRLVKALNAKDHIAKEIYAAAEPIRDQMKKLYGNKIILYRGILLDNTPYDKSKKYESWTSDEKIAEVFAGRRIFDASKKHPSLILSVPSDKEISDSVAKFKKTGFTKFLGMSYKITKDPDFYDIYDANRQFVTDGDSADIENQFKKKQKKIIERNKDVMERGKVFKKSFSIDSIVWITNNLQSKEYIVKVR